MKHWCVAATREDAQCALEAHDAESSPGDPGAAAGLVLQVLLVSLLLLAQGDIWLSPRGRHIRCRRTQAVAPAPSVGQRHTHNAQSEGDDVLEAHCFCCCWWCSGASSCTSSSRGVKSECLRAKVSLHHAHQIPPLFLQRALITAPSHYARNHRAVPCRSLPEQSLTIAVHTSSGGGGNGGAKRTAATVSMSQPGAATASNHSVPWPATATAAPSRTLCGAARALTGAPAPSAARPGAACSFVTCYGLRRRLRPARCRQRH
jgi:hypothetical protein